MERAVSAGVSAAGGVRRRGRISGAVADRLGFWRWRGVQGLGGGDVKLLAALGAWCGWPDLPALLLLASC
ncbi:A24 family peptidase [Edwardsiella anguillarum]|nr:A24 family peptidase [Edwardsiella anguillarum]